MSHHKTVKPGTPKKDGAGGKGTWGKQGTEYGSSGAIDPNDPNYDSEGDEPPTTPAIVVFKAGVANILDEYFASGDAGDINRALKELGHPELHHEFVKAVISRSLDLHDRERELASRLLPRLYPVVSRDKVIEGFTVLLERLEDLKLDIPSAPEYLSFFLARAVVDDILPPSFLSPDSADVEIAKETLVQARNLLSGKSAAKRMAHIWGPSGDQSVKKIKERIAGILDEYLVSNDMSEADRAIKDLAAPSFNYYVVKRAALRALDSKDAEKDKIVKLLSMLSTSGLISEAHFISGFKGCVDMMDDIELDTPNGKELLGSFVQRSILAGYLPQSFTEVYKQGLANSGAKKQQK
jgi:hypothetical protein